MIDELANDFECMWSKIVTSNSEFYVAVVYHPPNSDYLASDLVDHLIDGCEYIFFFFSFFFINFTIILYKKYTYSYD